MSEDIPVRRVAIVLFDGFTSLDAYGPIQAFGSCRRELSDGNRQRLFQVFTLGHRPGPIRSGEGPATAIDYGFGDAPPWDVLVVPGGFGTRSLVHDDKFLARLTQACERSPLLATICTGSALVARTGLLDGRPATSNKLAWNWVLEQGPNVQWRRQARWIDDGNILTSSGVAAGIDMTLHIVARVLGRDMALKTARNMEYSWNEDGSHDPFA